MNNLTYSVAGRKLTEEFEGLRTRAYQDEGGTWTIGYGHTGKAVIPNMVITPAEADTLLAGDVQAAVICVNQAIDRTLQQHEFDALIDFTFNVGRTAFLTSHLRKAVEQNFLPEVKREFLSWDLVGGVHNIGLGRRRTAEYAMYAGQGAA